MICIKTFQNWLVVSTKIVLQVTGYICPIVFLFDKNEKMTPIVLNVTNEQEALLAFKKLRVLAKRCGSRMCAHVAMATILIDPDEEQIEALDETGINPNDAINSKKAVCFQLEVGKTLFLAFAELKESFAGYTIDEDVKWVVAEYDNQSFTTRILADR